MSWEYDVERFAHGPYAKHTSKRARETDEDFQESPLTEQRSDCAFGYGQLFVNSAQTHDVRVYPSETSFQSKSTKFSVRFTTRSRQRVRFFIRGEKDNSPRLLSTDNADARKASPREGLAVERASRRFTFPGIACIKLNPWRVRSRTAGVAGAARALRSRQRRDPAAGLYDFSVLRTRLVPSCQSHAKS